MSQMLKVELPDQTYALLAQRAAQEGVSPEQWAASRLQACVPTPEERDAALAQLLRHAGSVDLGRPIGIDNEQIDRDLANAYADPHEPGG